jgi:hypothetical protein
VFFVVKRLGFLLLVVSLLMVSSAAYAAKIGIMTNTVSQNEEEYRAAEEMVAKYGRENVVHATFPDRFMDEQETTISQVVAMASDPDLKAIILCQAVPGSAAAINKVKEFRDDIIFIAGQPQEEPFMMAQTADILFEIDQPARAATIVQKAKDMGAETFVHISFPRHMAMPLLAQRRETMEKIAGELGMQFVFVNAPDPTGEGGVPGTQQFILEDTPRQVNQYGKNTAFFATNCAMQEPLIKSVIATSALYPEQCCPSPYHALPNALGISIPDGMAGNVPFILDAIAEKVHEGNMDGRIATWTAPMSMSFIRAGTALAMAYANGEFTDKKDMDRAVAALKGAAGDILVRPYDAKAPNFLMVIGETIKFAKN